MHSHHYIEKRPVMPRNEALARIAEETKHFGVWIDSELLGEVKKARKICEPKKGRHA